MWSEQLKNIILELKANANLREEFLQNPDLVVFTQLTFQEKRAVTKVFMDPKLVSNIGSSEYWY